MTKRLLLILLSSSVLLSTGCLFKRKNAKPKETSAIATEVETEFRTRWIKQRMSELTARGVAGPDAELQAAKEFQEKFAFANPRKK